MPRKVTIQHVKKARKANKQHGIEVGQEYWKWSGKANGRFFTRYFKHAPRASETTNSHEPQPLKRRGLFLAI